MCGVKFMADSLQADGLDTTASARSMRLCEGQHDEAGAVLAGKL